jgi:hypothetical protein
VAGNEERVKRKCGHEKTEKLNEEIS